MSWKAIFLFLLFFLPFSSNAQSTYNEIPSSCYTLGTSTITFPSSFTVDCLNSLGITGSYITNHDYPSGTFVSDQLGSKDGDTEDLKCNAPSTCIFGFGTSPSAGQTQQFRFADSYLGSPYKTITIIYNDGIFSPFFGVSTSSLPTFNETYNTQFLNATVSFSTSTKPSFLVNYYIDTDDFIGINDRPDTVTVTISSATSTQVDLVKKLILPLSTGTSSTTLNSDVLLPDGTYTASIVFFNLFSSDFVFTRSNLTLNFTVSGGSITSQTIVSAQNGIWPSSTVTFDCSIFNPWECIKNLIYYLFVIPPGSQTALTWYSQGSSSVASSFLDSGTDLITTSLSMGETSTTTAESLNMSLTIPIGNATITLPIISFTEVDEKMGNADEIFRLVSLATLVIFALGVYIGNVQRAWRIISFKGIDT